MDEVRIVPTGEQYAAGFNAVVDAVARERRYIGFVAGPPLESTREFIRTKGFATSAGSAWDFFRTTAGEAWAGNSSLRRFAPPAKRGSSG
jgi:hypothetical protein